MLLQRFAVWGKLDSRDAPCTTVQPPNRQLCRDKALAWIARREVTRCTTWWRLCAVKKTDLLQSPRSNCVALNPYHLAFLGDVLTLQPPSIFKRWDRAGARAGTRRMPWFRMALRGLKQKVVLWYEDAHTADFCTQQHPGCWCLVRLMFTTKCLSLWSQHLTKISMFSQWGVGMRHRQELCFHDTFMFACAAIAGVNACIQSLLI